MNRILAIVAAVFCVLFLAIAAFKPAPAREFNGGDFSRLPVLLNGRFKPMDTVARTSLLVIHGKQSLTLYDEKSGEKRREKLPAVEWLLEVLFDAPSADKRRPFLIVNAEVLSLIGEKPGEKKHFTFEELNPHLAEIERQAIMADGIEAQLRSPFQRQVLKLQRAIGLYSRLQHSLQLPGATGATAELDRFLASVDPGLEASRLRKDGKPFDEEARATLTKLAAGHFRQAEHAWFFPVPPAKSGPDTKPEDWRKIGTAVMQSVDEEGGLPETVKGYAVLGDAYRAGDESDFQAGARELREHLAGVQPVVTSKVGRETSFNRFAPFTQSTVLYIIAFLLACFFWLGGWKPLGQAAMIVLFFALAVHAGGLFTRMWLESRPPVTNLYSSAVFVGFGSVVLGALLEWIYRNGVGTATAAIIGIVTLVIARHLAVGGDTMEMMRAVLDSNFWLATHVIVITLGYSATFLAGTLALIYILRKFAFGQLEAATGKSLARMVYGIVCFATLFSFVGTILGGIWADQSWGRFWGWDPKENGALLIVLWNAIILHARWGGMIRERGLMVLAVFGNIVTAWSWFGTNMLGVGLHSYGFTDAAFRWLLIFVVTQLLFMGLGMWGREWRRGRVAAAKAGKPVSATAG